MEEKDFELKRPYYVVTYIDDEGKKHLAMIDDDSYLQFIEERFVVVDKKYVDND